MNLTRLPRTLSRSATAVALAFTLLLASQPANAFTVVTPYSGLYVFGDSLSDPGNVWAALDATTRAIGAAQAVTGNTYIPGLPYASRQFTNVDVWAISFAGMLGLPTAGNSYLTPGGGNFAYGGAQTSVDGLTPSLLSQVGTYLTTTSNSASSSALYVVAGGGNDARAAVQAAAVAATPAAAGAIITAAATQYATNTLGMVTSLRAAGANNIIVWNVPNVGLAPAITAFGNGLAGLGSLVASSMNSAMQGALAPVSALAPGVKLFDGHALLSQAVTSAATFGLSNVHDACGNLVLGCDLATSLFWDGIHPTAAGHALLAQRMYTLAAAPVPEPETMLLMAVGLLSLRGLQRRRQAATLV